MHSSPNIIHVTKSRRMRWVGHVAYKGKREVQKTFLWGHLKDIENLEDPGADGRIMLKCIFKKWD